MNTPQMIVDFAERILQREVLIGVVGIGYIGLPTATFFADGGFKVIGIDIDADKVDSLNSGVCYIDEPNLHDIVSKVVDNGLLKATTDYSLLQDCDIIFLCTQTPIHSDGTANLDKLYSATNSAAIHAKENVLLICESTVPPRTIDHIVSLFLNTGRYTVDNNLWAAHCPERVLPGQVVKEFKENIRIIGGFTNDSGILTQTLYRCIVDANKIFLTNSLVSEFAKLAENTFRAVNIALANELAIISDTLGIDVSAAIPLANLHPRVRIHNPGVGVGGHCIPKDPALLAHSVIPKGVHPALILDALEINKTMPNYSIQRLLHAMNLTNFDGTKILILGATFKENVDDTRLSPSKSLIEELLTLRADVKVHDNHTTERFGMQDAGSLSEAIEWADVLLLAVAHDDYMNALPNFDLSHKVFFDGRNSFSSQSLDAKIYIGVGRPIIKSDRI